MKTNQMHHTTSSHAGLPGRGKTSRWFWCAASTSFTGFGLTADPPLCQTALVAVIPLALRITTMGKHLAKLTLSQPSQKEE